MRLAYGTEELQVTWPGGAEPDVIAYPAEAFEPAAAVERLRRALRAPIASDSLPRLAAGRRNAVVLVSDATRLCPTADLLPALLDALNEGGIPDGRIRVVVALGTHRQQTPEELRRIAGAAFGRVAVVNHSAAPDDCVRVGVTSLGTPIEVSRAVAEADFRVAVGNIEPHLLVGLSGGGKALFPGVASAPSIERHHALSLRFSAVAGYADNPLFRDIEEACAMVPIHFLCNVVVDHRRRLLDIFAGDVQEAHRAGGRFARAQFLVPVRRRYDVVIASAGGAPKDMQLYQAIKSLENAASFAKPGGAVLLVARCEELYGNGAFQTWAETHADRERAVRELGDTFVLGAHKLRRLHAITSKHTVYLHSSVPAPLATLLGVHPVEDIQAWVNANAGPGVDAAVLPCAALTFPVP